MRLISNWQQIIRKAWSIRLMIVAAVLSGIEVAIPFFSESLPRGLFSAVSAVTTGLAFVARLMAQQEIENAE